MRKVRTLVLGGVAASLCAASPASAAVTCSYDQDADTLTVASGSSGDFAIIGSTAVGAEIVVGDLTASATRDCDVGEGVPTGANTGTVSLTSGGGDSSWIISEPELLGPGPVGDPVDLIAFLGGGTDGFSTLDSAGDTDDFWQLGAAGMNWNGDNDVDATFVGAEAIGMFGSSGADALTARGAHGADTPLPGTVAFFGDGGIGNDVIEGGEGADGLLGAENDDTLRGFGGEDDIGGGTGTNQLLGGAGNDHGDYLTSPVGVTVDLGVTGPQNTGNGIDTLNGIEGLRGSNQSDDLTGDAGLNSLRGEDGDDTLDGRGDEDHVNGGAGADLITYAQAPAGVSANLTTGEASGGAGPDVMTSVENLVGTPFADNLTGDNVGNSITGLAGNDTISALEGADRVDVRDGGPDAASCGADADTATADQASVDSVNADCETVSFLPEGAGAGGGGGDGGGGGGGGGADGLADTDLSFDLSGKARQDFLNQKGVVVRALCPRENCTATASGKGKLPKPRRSPLAKLNLTPVTEAVAAGVAERIKLGLKRKQLRAIAAALRAGKKPKVSVSATVTDAAGNSATDLLVVRAKP